MTRYPERRTNGVLSLPYSSPCSSKKFSCRCDSIFTATTTIDGDASPRFFGSTISTLIRTAANHKTINSNFVHERLDVGFLTELVYRVFAQCRRKFDKRTRKEQDFILNTDALQRQTDTLCALLLKSYIHHNGTISYVCAITQTNEVDLIHNTKLS